MRGHSARSQNVLKREQAAVERESPGADAEKGAQNQAAGARGQADGGERQGNEARACGANNAAHVSHRRLCTACTVACAKRDARDGRRRAVSKRLWLAMADRAEQRSSRQREGQRPVGKGRE
jgi:hypothetical protein